MSDETMPPARSAAPKRPRLRRCQLYTAGHVVHWIQAIHSGRHPHRDGHLVNVEENVITVDYGDEKKQYRNHSPDRLVGIVGIGGEVRVCESYEILRGGGSYCFSISPIDRDWRPCDFTPLRSATPEALAERMQSHGGFSVPGRLAIDSLGE